MDWNVLELRANKKLDQNFSKTFQEVVIKSYNGRARHNESKMTHPSLRPTLPMLSHPTGSGPEGGDPAVASTQDKPLLLSTRSEEGAETITVKLNEPVGPSDELRIQLKKGDDVYSTIVQIPGSLQYAFIFRQFHSNQTNLLLTDNLSPSASQGSIVQIEAPFLLVSNFFPRKDDPIDQMIIVRNI